MLIAVLLVFGFVRGACAQESLTPVQSGLATGSIQGVVSDRNGAVSEGVHVVLSRQAVGGAPVTGSPAIPDASTTTGSDGRYVFGEVPPGPFRLTISSAGFATQAISGALHSGESYQALPVTLLLTAATSEIRVTASAVEVTQEQLKEEEQQHVLGFIPNFYVVYAPNASALSTRQKFHLAWRSSIDPATIAITGAIAGVEQANNGLKGYGQGAQGYGKRFGANYADGFIGTMLGGAVFPSLLKQDPRYFYKGTGSIRHRALYAIAMAVICKGDNGHWQVDYSGILGSLASGGISNLYYPASDRNGAGLTFENALVQNGANAIGNLFQEFVVRKFTPKLPNYGQSKP